MCGSNDKMRIAQNLLTFDYFNTKTETWVLGHEKKNKTKSKTPQLPNTR